VTGLVALALGAALATPPSLAGTWTLNKEESEDARAKMREGDGAGRPPGGWRGGPGGGGGMGSPGMGGRGGGFEGRGADRAGGRDEAARSFIEAAETLTITQTADEIGVDDGERVLHLHPDGKKIKSDGGGTETTTTWRDSELVVETKAEHGRKVTSAYMLVPEKRQLHVTSTMEGRSGAPITVRRVYDAAAVEAGQ
jgi:hypothetical protein